MRFIAIRWRIPPASTKPRHCSLLKPIGSDPVAPRAAMICKAHPKKEITNGLEAKEKGCLQQVMGVAKEGIINVSLHWFFYLNENPVLQAE